ncbi:MAG: SPOR domain-containing protein [Limnobacter sp.]|nr:SPOR domain-containing protein [Limnobacter sp.]
MFIKSKYAFAGYTIKARHQTGASVSTFIIGMVCGLVVALGVALYVTKAELPFSNAKTQAASPNLNPGPGQTPPDPNSSIYNRTGGTAPGLDAVPEQSNQAAAAPEAKPPTSITSSTEAPAAAAKPAEPVAQTIYYLQMGSFRNREDAENLRARLAFIGTESEIAVGDANGVTVNRVRVGPFTNANEAYQARVPLTKGGFEATVVKQ